MLKLNRRAVIADIQQDVRPMTECPFNNPGLPGGINSQSRINANTGDLCSRPGSKSLDTLAKGFVRELPYLSLIGISTTPERCDETAVHPSEFLYTRRSTVRPFQCKIRQPVSSRRTISRPIGIGATRLATRVALGRRTVFSQILQLRDLILLTESLDFIGLPQIPIRPKLF